MCDKVDDRDGQVHLTVVSSTCKDQEDKVCRGLELLLEDILTYLEESERL